MGEKIPVQMIEILIGQNSKGQTEWNKRVSAKICGFLSFSAKIRGFLRKSAPPKCFPFQEKAKICKNQRKTANLASHVPFSLSPLIKLFLGKSYGPGGPKNDANKKPSSRYRCEALISQLRALLRNTVVASAIASDAASTSSSFERVNSQALLAMLKSFEQLLVAPLPSTTLYIAVGLCAMSK